MILNRGQSLQMNVGYAVAIRTAIFLDALLDFYEKNAPGGGSAVDVARQKLREYR